MNDKDFFRVRQLVGEVTERQLRNVDCYVSENLGIFVPSVGFCEYAITPSHTHPSYSFTIFPTLAQTYMTIEIDVPANHYAAAAMAPRVPHEEPVHDTFVRYIAVCISETFYLEQYAFYDKKAPVIHGMQQFSVKDEVMTYIRAFMNEYENRKNGGEVMLDALAKLITHDIIRGFEKFEASEETQMDKGEILKAAEYMQQNFGQKLTVKQIAETINMSESHFIRNFKKEMHTTPICYLIKIRIEKSKKLLRNKEQSITDIALQCGFNSASHFSAVFIRQMDITPTHYRDLY